MSVTTLNPTVIQRHSTHCDDVNCVGTVITWHPGTAGDPRAFWSCDTCGLLQNTSPPSGWGNRVASDPNDPHGFVLLDCDEDGEYIDIGEDLNEELDDMKCICLSGIVFSSCPIHG